MDKEVINMENIGVTCDVCACCHNVDGCKCDLPQIKVTEQCNCTRRAEYLFHDRGTHVGGFLRQMPERNGIRTSGL